MIAQILFSVLPFKHLRCHDNLDKWTISSKCTSGWAKKIERNCHYHEDCSLLIHSFVDFFLFETCISMKFNAINLIFFYIHIVSNKFGSQNLINRVCILEIYFKFITLCFQSSVYCKYCTVQKFTIRLKNTVSWTVLVMSTPNWRNWIPDPCRWSWEWRE